jgi:hypothetical protein
MKGHMLKGIHFTLMSSAIAPGPGAPPSTPAPEPVPKDVAEAFVSAQVTQATGPTAKSGFSLTFSLGKGSGIRRRFEAGFFDPPRRVVLYATLNGQINVLSDGVITRHEVSSSNDPGQSRLTVIGEDLTRLLDLIDFSWIFKYPCMPAEARVLLILAKYVPLGMVPMVVPSVNLDIPLPTRRIPSHMGTDLQYLTYLANSVGYTFYVEPGKLPGTSIAYWGPEMTLSDPQQALIVNSDAASNVDALSFNFNGFAKTLYVMLIRDEALPVPIPIPIPDVNPLSPPMGRRMPIPLQVQPLSGVSHYNPAQAIMVGLAKAARASDVITGTGTLNVMRYGQLLMPRRFVEVRGAGYPHDGLHFVRSVTHNIKPGEYKQSFTLSRNGFEPFSLASAVLSTLPGAAGPPSISPGGVPGLPVPPAVPGVRVPGAAPIV